MNRQSLAVCCTDKGNHPWTSLGDVALIDGLLKVNMTFRYTEKSKALNAASVWSDSGSPGEARIHLRCPRCHRHVQWREQRARTVISAMCEAFGDGTQLDISAIP